MEKYEIEERLHKVFKNSLDMKAQWIFKICLLYTSPSPRDA